MTQGMALRLQDSEMLEEYIYRVVTGTNPDDKKNQSVCASLHVVSANNC